MGRFKWVVNKDGMLHSWSIPSQSPGPSLPTTQQFQLLFLFLHRRPFNLGLHQQCRLSSHTHNALGSATPTKCPVMPLWSIMSKASLAAISFCFDLQPPYTDHRPPPTTFHPLSRELPLWPDPPNRSHCSSLPAPPASIEIKGYSHNSKVEVRENQDLQLKCIVANAKPAAQIVWYRGNVEYKPG